ncbi:MAG: adenylate/guanylate cyclase domain-containing protein [Pseudomonadota bacterium]
MTISRFLILLFVTLALLLGSLFTSLAFLAHTQEDIAASERKRFESFRLADQLRQSSDDLTHMARLYVITGDQRFADYFDEILHIRHGASPRPEGYELVYWDLVLPTGERPQSDGQLIALEDMMVEQGFTVEELRKLWEAQSESDALAELEEAAMHAVRGRYQDGFGAYTQTGEPDPDKARDIMFGQDYFEAKAAIMLPINEFFVILNARTASEVSELRQQATWLTAAALGICFATLLVIIASFFVLRKKLIQPLSHVSVAAQKVSTGDFSQRVAHDSGDEMGQMITAFNNMVASTKDSLEKLSKSNADLQDKQSELEREKQASDSLLLNILPSVIAKRLKGGETSIADEFPEVSVLFADLVGFTEMTDEMGPYEIVKLLNDIFALFDRRIEDYGLEKIKTMGDCYMAVSGVPEPRADHARRIADFALIMQEDFARHTATHGIDIELRVGIHSGTAVAGIVGEKKFAYDLWGDVVNVASRMETTGQPRRIHVTEAFKVRLADVYAFEEVGEIEVKGKGAMRTYFLLGRRFEQT